jgi:hypothetical protein
MPKGWSSIASVAGPQSPEKPRSPVPAAVEMVPSGLTSRTRWFSWSVKWIVPSRSAIVIITGGQSAASMSGPPPPAYFSSPVPATVEMVPSRSTLRMRWLAISAR